MIKSILLTTILLLCVGILFGQATQEEYNYVTKGYHVQIESGLDMKKGYELKDIDNVQQPGNNNSIERQAWLKALYRVSPNGTKNIAAYMLVYERAGRVKEYLCVPTPSSSQFIREAYYNSLNQGGGDNSVRLQIISFLLSRSLKWQ